MQHLNSKAPNSKIFSINSTHWAMRIPQNVYRESTSSDGDATVSDGCNYKKCGRRDQPTRYAPAHL